jgi:hypothetical protein
MRYYKATEGTVTVFRGTNSRVYLGAWIHVVSGPRANGYGFSMKRGAGQLAAVEITKTEYNALNDVKQARILAAGGSLKYVAPCDSWVRNADLPEKNPPLKKEGIYSPPIEEKAAPVFVTDPTKTTYLSLVQAYEYLNANLFAGRLPTCLVTLQRKANCRGYFAGGRFASRDGARTTDEIALNPSTFKERDTKCILSTLAHEMVHLQQHHFGKPGKGGYHNKEWGDLMLVIDLKPVSLDQPGKMVGNKVTHEVVPGGWFDRVCDELIGQGVQIDYVEVWTDEGKAKATKKLKVKYSCPECGINCWAKPECSFICGDCNEPMEAEDSDGN